MDPIANMLIMLKNASRAKKTAVTLPYSKMKEAVAFCLKKEGYVGNYSKKAKKNQNFLEIELIYSGKRPKITDVERVSKQSRRVYLGIKQIYPVKGGEGILVLSTPKGVLSGGDARKEHVGGEALFKIF